MNTFPWKPLLFGIVLGLFLTGAILLVAQQPRGEGLILTPPPTPPTTIVIYITGAIKNPGLYTLPRSSRVNDAVEAAGGLIEVSDRLAINLAAKIEDGAKIVVPALVAESTGQAGQTPRTSATPLLTPTINFPININSADATMLDNLPGIGPSKAGAIQAYRQEHGPFTKIEDIMNVPGIGSGLFNSIKDFITVTENP